MVKILDKILRMGEGRTLKRLTAIADQVDALEESFQDLTDAELREETDSFRERIEDGETLDSILPEAFAVVREAAVRTLGQRHYRVQIMGGAALHLGNIAEMKTGEGKTLVATLPSYLRALTGKGVHVVTVNDYLASYQSELMGRIHRFLGMTTGCIVAGQKPAERREQYAADITYGTNNEFGFDYLRDNMAKRMEDLVQRDHYFVIVDEVDSILIDEARTPLIISGPSQGGQNNWYPTFAKIVPEMERDVDYEVDEKKRTVGVLEPGIEKVEDYLGIDNLYESVNTPLISLLSNALRAKELFHSGDEYIVEDGEVTIVDEHTGRRLRGRRYNDGLHQAIEAKEGVKIKAENQTMASITLQNYFRLYDTLAGMTGTAETEAAEFSSTYKIGVVPIPTNKEMIRKDQDDIVYKGHEAKFKAIVDDISERHEKGQPVLVGTTSVDRSEHLSKLLSNRKIPHDVLNAKQHEREASVVAEAGRKGAVTVATNMAGRGTDIMLGGNPEHIAHQRLRERGMDATEDAEAYEEAWATELERAKKEVETEHNEVLEAGGLYVLGSERHESRRIDNQLRGRAGRQGDPGESRFYLSFEDDLMRLFATGMAARVIDSSNYPDDVALEFKWVTNGIRQAQAALESRHYESRKNVLKYDDVMDRQRRVIYEQRRRVLEGEDLEDQMHSFTEDVVEAVITTHTAEGSPEMWDLDSLLDDLRGYYPVTITTEDLIEEAGNATRVSHDMLSREIKSDVRLAYQNREAEVGEETLRMLERRVVLGVLDRQWREHLYEMDYLKEGIGLRAMGQRDPLVEYQREGYMFFQAMNEAIKEESVRYLFNIELESKTVDAKSAAAAAVSVPGMDTEERPLEATEPERRLSSDELREAAAAQKDATKQSAAAGSAYAASALGRGAAAGAASRETAGGGDSRPKLDEGSAFAQSAAGKAPPRSRAATTTAQKPATTDAQAPVGDKPDAGDNGEPVSTEEQDRIAKEDELDRMLGLDGAGDRLTFQGASSDTSGSDPAGRQGRPATAGASQGSQDGMNRAQRRAAAKKNKNRN